MDRIRVMNTNLQFREPPPMRPRTDYFVIHHFGTMPTTLDPLKIDADYVNDMHMRERGWIGIGYHFVVKTDGIVERGRGESDMGAHDAGENARSIGILVVGDFQRPGSNPTARQIAALQLLLADLHEKYGLSPSPTTICGHRDNEPPETPTECPGDNLYTALPLITQVVRYMVKA